MNGYSLPYVKFTVRHEHELRVHWHSLASLEYGRRWIKSLEPEDVPARLTKFPGDNRLPFTHVDIPPAQFLDHIPGAIQSLSHRTLVQIVTVFETYIYDAFQRAIFLDPERVKDSKATFEASTLSAEMNRKSLRSWFAHQMADRYARRLTHSELIGRLAKVVKSGVTQQSSAECSEWQRWVLVRNSVVHLGGTVSADLAKAWPSKFGTERGPIVLSDKDIIRCAHVSRVIAKNLDKRLVQEIVRDQDQALMAQEMFVRTGVSDPKKLSAAISKRMGANMKTAVAAEAIAVQRKGLTVEHGFGFVDEMLPSV